jgi:glycerate 2-kinase
MNILFCPDKLKGSLSASEICALMEQSALGKNKKHSISYLPLADGGEGFSDIFTSKKDYQTIYCPSVDALGRPIKTSFLYKPETQQAIITLSDTCGLEYLKSSECNPEETSTYGVGLVLLEALKLGTKNIVLGIGGSATNEAGMGIAQALGYNFLDKNKQKLAPIGKNLVQVHFIKTPTTKIWKDCNITVASDVNNPLFGPLGAAKVYAKQKGANDQQIDALDLGLAHLAKLCLAMGFADYAKGFGAGAAGGVGFGLHVFLGATVKSGASIALEATHFFEKIKNTDVVIGAEGCLDQQSMQGKLVNSIGQECIKHQKTLVIICGKNELSHAETKAMGIHKVWEISRYYTSIDQSIKKPQQGLSKIFAELNLWLNTWHP